MIKQVQKDIYQIVRQPYLKYNKKIQNLVALIVMLPNFALSFYYFFSTKGYDFLEVIIRTELLKIFKLGIQPFIMFFLPGVLYY